MSPRRLRLTVAQLRPGDVVRETWGGRVSQVLCHDRRPGQVHVLRQDGSLVSLPASSLEMVTPHFTRDRAVMACIRRDHPDAPPEATTCPRCGLPIRPIA